MDTLRVPHDYFSDLVRLISPTGKALLAMLGVYLDDSGDQNEPRENEPGVFVMAGYLASPSQMDECQRNWDEILDAFNRTHGLNIRYFHMTDLIAGREDCKGVDKLVRASLLTKMCALIKARTMVGVGSVVMMRDYINVLGNPNPKIRPISVPPPIVLCSEGAAVVARSWTLSHGSRQPLAFTIERGTTYYKDLREGFSRALDGVEKHLFALDSIVDAPKQCIGLQMADMHAWALAAEHKGSLEYKSANDSGSRIPDVFRLQLQGFLATHPHEYWVWSEARLRSALENHDKLDGVLQQLAGRMGLSR